ncbi:hypothetical protein [Marinicella gelatinilytica]|uniref:hypothetical protein n=1 Tax=Marinicella gelatinilytica TaxID=2996017 RepID=UPI002260B4E5|nr:hypothetical protein [Marinicella gelatinilytica]MCX7545512.1 hypothetical protein [Marinicella gelatinilytica]
MITLPKPDDKILWSWGNNITQIPEARLNDPFITAHVKYFNSQFFSEACTDQSRYIKAFNIILTVLDDNDWEFTPPQIFGAVVSYLKSQDLSEKSIYLYYTSARTVCRRENIGSGRGIQSYSHLLSLVEYSNEEVKILREADSFAPILNTPIYTPFPDLITKFGLDCDGDALIKSIRSFCIYYLCEWSKVRCQIYEKYPDEVCEILKHPNKGKRLFSSGSKKHELTESGQHIPTLIFNIIKGINNPILNEYFTSAYLNVFPDKKKFEPSQIIKQSYSFDSFTSNANETDWLHEINEQFISKRTGRLVSLHWAYERLNRVGYLNDSKSYSVTSEWSGSLASIPSIKDFFGVTTSEEICMAWLLATDRHQPTNLANLLLDDLKVTDNSISTIIDVYSYKARSGNSAGTSYSEMAGGIYKKNSNIFKAISGYVTCLEKAYDMNVFSKTNKDGGRHLFPTLRIDYHDGSAPSIRSTFFNFNKTSMLNCGIKLCSMSGSVSNEYTLKEEPNSKLFLDLIAKSYILGRENSDFNNSIAVNTVARQAVNNSNVFNYSSEAIPLSGNSKAEVSSDEYDEKIEIDAAKHNHSVETKLNVYADRLPSHLAKLVNFSARVGDEIVKLTSVLKDSSEILTTSQLRERLGITTVLENEISQMNDEVNSIMEQAFLQGSTLDDTGLIYNEDGKTIILRHPLTIAMIKGKIDAIDQQIELLEYSNDNLLHEMISKRMFLALVLDEAFSPTEIRESNKKYKGVTFPFSDILV